MGIPGEDKFEGKGKNAKFVPGYGRPSSLDEAKSAVGQKLKWASSLEELNKNLPKKYRLNNTDWRNFTGGQEKPWKRSSDTIGDLLLSKYAKKEGYDAVVSKSFQKTMSAKDYPYGVSEVMIPSESRHDLSPNWQSNLANFLHQAKTRPNANPELELLMARRGTPLVKEVTTSVSPPPTESLYSKFPKVEDINSPALTPGELGKWAAKEKAKKHAIIDKALSSPGSAADKFKKLTEDMEAVDYVWDTKKEVWALKPNAEGFTPLFPPELPEWKKSDLAIVAALKKSAGEGKIDQTSEDWAKLVKAYPELGEIPSPTSAKKKWTKAERTTEFGNAGIKPKGQDKVFFTSLEDMASPKILPKNSAKGQKLLDNKYWADKQEYQPIIRGKSGEALINPQNTSNIPDLLNLYKTGKKMVRSEYGDDYYMPKHLNTPANLQNYPSTIKLLLEHYGMKPFEPQQ